MKIKRITSILTISIITLVLASSNAFALSFGPPPTHESFYSIHVNTIPKGIVIDKLQNTKNRTLTIKNQSNEPFYILSSPNNNIPQPEGEWPDNSRIVYRFDHNSSWAWHKSNGGDSISFRRTSNGELEPVGGPLSWQWNEWDNTVTLHDWIISESNAIPSVDNPDHTTSNIQLSYYFKGQKDYITITKENRPVSQETLDAYHKNVQKVSEEWARANRDTSLKNKLQNFFRKIVALFKA